MADYDVLVLGAGPAGEVVAGRCADGGLRTAIVEGELVGGECSYWGCIPSKTLIRPGDLLAAARRAPGAAEAISGPVDAGAAFAQRDSMTSRWHDDGAKTWLDDKHIDLIRGTGRLVGRKQVAVGERVIDVSTAIVVAVGTEAVVPPIAGLAGAAPWTNRGATAAHAVPSRLIVLGGGAVGVEMAQAYRRLGAGEVTLVEAGPRLLAREEPFAGEEVAAAFRAEGIDVILGTPVTEVRRAGPGTPVTVVADDGRVFVGDELLVAVGRRPRTADIGLDRVGLAELAGKPLPTDDRMRVSDTDWLYAVGDCNGRALLTHMGKYQARICGDVILGKDAAVRDIVPRVTFTDPQVAAVGLTAEQAQLQDRSVRTVRTSTGGVAGAYVQGNDVAGTSFLVVDELTRTIVGATFTGPAVQELLHSATVAIAGHVTLDDLWHAVPSFPTVSEVWLNLLEAYGM